MDRNDAEAWVEKVKEADKDGTFTSMKLKSASVSAVIHRATGEDEDIGYVAYYHRNPIKHYYINLLIWIRGRIRLYGNSINQSR